MLLGFVHAAVAVEVHVPVLFADTKPTGNSPHTEAGDRVAITCECVCSVDRYLSVLRHDWLVNYRPLFGLFLKNRSFLLSHEETLSFAQSYP